MRGHVPPSTALSLFGGAASAAQDLRGRWEVLGSQPCLSDCSNLLCLQTVTGLARNQEGSPLQGAGGREIFLLFCLFLKGCK